MLPGKCSEKHFKGAAYFITYLEYLEEFSQNTVFRPYINEMLVSAYPLSCENVSVKKGTIDQNY